MRRKLLLLLTAAVTAGCGVDPDLGERFRAERDLWRISREIQRLSIRPDLVEEDQWRDMIRRYEALAERYGSVTSGPEDSEAREIRLIVARGMTTAAHIHATLGDSTRTMELYSEIEASFPDIPLVSGDVAMARGRMAEARQQWGEAVNAYRHVIISVAPNPVGAGVEAAVLELPLRVARIEARARGNDPDLDKTAIYFPTIDYYQKAVASPEAEPPLILEARSYLAEAFSDLGDFDGALEQLHALSEENSALDPPPQDPAAIKLAIASTRKKSGDFQGSRETLTAIVSDYPESEYASQALMALALQAGEQKQWDEAVAHLARIREEYGDNEDMAAQALFMQGQAYEESGRWSQAMEIFRALPVEHPLSEPALRAPLAVISHYTKNGDETAKNAAIKKAEEDYRTFLSRFPSGQPSYSAHDKLIGVLQLQERWEDALTEMLVLGEALSRTPQGANYFLNAARIAYVNLEDAERAAEILDQLSQLYPRGEIGEWAQREAQKLREDESE